VSRKLLQELKIALFGVTEFASGLSGTQSLTLAFEKHGQLAGNLVIVGQEDRTGRPDELSRRIEQLDMVPTWEGKRLKSQIKYGGFFRVGIPYTYEANALKQAHEVRHTATFN